MRSQVSLGFVLSSCIAGASAVLLPSCDGHSTSGAGPGGPSSDQVASIVLSVMSPAAGTPVTITDCPAGATTPLCSQQVSGTFNVTYNRAVSQALVFVDFYAASGTRCAVATTLPKVNLVAGVTVAMSFNVVFASLPPELPQFCTMPF